MHMYSISQDIVEKINFACDNFNTVEYQNTSPISQSLVDGPSKEDIQQKSLYDHKADDTPGKPKPVQVILNKH